MLNDRRHSTDSAMFTPQQLRTMTANEVAEATAIAADALRKAKTTDFVYGIVKRLDASCKGGAPRTSKEYDRKRAILDSLVQELYSLGSYHILRRHVVPVVNYAIETASFIGQGRKSKVLNQWRVIIGEIDRVTI